MTKTITMPISKETCNTIKKSIGWFLWIGFTVLAIYGFIYVWYDMGDWYLGSDWKQVVNGKRLILGVVSFIIMISQPILMLNYLRSTDHWIKIQCSCEAETIKNA